MQRREFLQSITGTLATAGLTSAAVGQFTEPASRPSPGTIDVGSRKELFVDDLLMDEVTGLSKVVTRPEKYLHNPVLRSDRPWEPQPGEKNAHGIGIAGNAVIFDVEEQLFKCWYLCFGPPERSFACYAVSRDGLTWEKPDLGIFEYRGSKQNNILGIYGDPQYFNYFKDANELDLRKRYKAMGEWENSPTANTHGGAYVGYSADGLHWTPYDENPVIRHGPNLGDAPTMLGWDPIRRKYVCYPRPGHLLAPEIRGVGFHRHIRSLGYAESDDFVHWTPTVPMLMPDRGDRVDFQYERFLVGVSGQYYFGFIPMRQSFDRTFEIYALASRDGFHWHWLDRNRPFLERGEVGAYDGGGISCTGPVVRDNQVYIYYNGSRYKHRPTINSPPGPNDQTTISVAMLPADRYLAIVAGPHLGTLLTKPLKFAGSKLLLDMEGSVPVDLERAEAGAQRVRTPSFDDAEVRVALFDQSGGAIEGFGLKDCRPLTESGVQAVTWGEKDLGTLAGKLVRLRFELRNAGLYSFQFV